MLNRFLGIGLIVVFGFLLTGCGGAPSSGPEPTPEEEKEDLDSQLDL
ncbi:MAG: hypothetical protein HYV60_06690 [Planctomycetia bacterium]|nr:hypothetical protein [Planctomycetia bacterium]